MAKEKRIIISEQGLADILQITPRRVREVCRYSKTAMGRYNLIESIKEFFEQSDNKDKEYVTAKRLGEVFKISEKTIRNLVDRNILTRNEKGSFDLIESVSAYLDYLHANSDTQQLRAIQAKRLQLKYEKESNELHSTDEVEIFISKMIVSFRQRILAIPSRIGKDLLNKTERFEIEEILKDELYIALEELSEYEVSDTEADEEKP